MTNPVCYYCEKEMLVTDAVTVTFSKGEISRKFHASCGIKAIQDSFKSGK